MQQRNSAVLAAAALAIATIGTATIGTGAASASGTTVVQVPRRNCSAPEPGHAACLSIRLVNKRVSRAAAAKMRADGRARPSSVKKLADGPAGGYTPAQLAKAYGINPAAATTQTVAIVDAYSDPTVRADLNTFDKKYGIPTETSTSFKAVGQTGGAVPAPPASGTPNAGWADEITLDVQAVRAMCHHCKILLVETKSNNDPDLAAGVNYAAKHASIISNSYGEPEKGANQSKATAAAYNHKGVAILASTGDDGWFDWDFFNLNNPNNPEPPDTPETSSNSPELPASQRSVIGVGGTSLYLNPDGTRASETVWNDNGPADYYGWYDAYNYGAGGSGCSTLYAPNAWQKSVAGYATLGCGAKRSAVDIAADADYLTGFDICQNFNNTDSAKCGWSTIGGTSLASPLVAGMWGLAGGPG
ncbi:MAG TPA: S8 family serine peptidase, partial [Marmoricola sp.]